MRIETHPIFQWSLIKLPSNNYTQGFMPEALYTKTHGKYLAANFEIHDHLKMNFTLNYFSMSDRIMGDIKWTDAMTYKSLPYVS